VVEAAHKLQREATMTDLHDFHKRYEKHQKAIAEAKVLNKAVVFDALAAAGITRITTTFDGEGDEGQLSGIEAYKEETKATLPTVPRRTTCARRFGLYSVVRRLGQGNPPRTPDGPRREA
jgi:hypothetical protein